MRYGFLTTLATLALLAAGCSSTSVGDGNLAGGDQAERGDGPEGSLDGYGTDETGGEQAEGDLDPAESLADGDDDGQDISDGEEVDLEKDTGDTVESDPDPDVAESDGDYETPLPGFVPITAGPFWMGSPAGSCPEGYPGSCLLELGRDSDETLHYVQLTRDFEMSRYEITQAEFQALMGYNPSTFSSCGLTCPVETVSWHEACAYSNALSMYKGYTPCYDCSGTEPNFTCTLKTAYTKPQDCPGYRLPTEAEWEFAARAESTTAFYPSSGNDGTITQPGCSPIDPNLDQIGWYCGNSGYTTRPAGGKMANTWGLYDMSGNVWEWCWDWWDGASDYGQESVIDPTGQASSSSRVVRGGCWECNARNARSALRDFGDPGYRRGGDLGFRPVRSLDVKPVDGDLDVEPEPEPEADMEPPDIEADPEAE